MNFFDNFNDTYKTPKDEVLGDSFYRIQTSGGILKQRREELGMTKQQVANKAHILLKQYTRLENDERDIAGSSFRIAMSICHALELDPNRFFPVGSEQSY